MTIPQYGCSIEQKEIKGAEIHSMASLLETWSNILIYSEPSRDCLGGYLKKYVESIPVKLNHHPVSLQGTYKMKRPNTMFKTCSPQHGRCSTLSTVIMIIIIIITS
jgi:hypothetical protein